MSRNQSLTKVVFVMPFIHIFKDPYKTSYQKSVILHFPELQVENGIKDQVL